MLPGSLLGGGSRQGGQQGGQQQGGQQVGQQGSQLGGSLQASSGRTPFNGGNNRPAPPGLLPAGTIEITGPGTAEGQIGGVSFGIDWSIETRTPPPQRPIFPPSPQRTPAPIRYTPPDLPRPVTPSNAQPGGSLDCRAVPEACLKCANYARCCDQPTGSCDFPSTCHPDCCSYWPQYAPCAPEYSGPGGGTGLDPGGGTGLNPGGGTGPNQGGGTGLNQGGGTRPLNPGYNGPVATPSGVTPPSCSGTCARPWMAIDTCDCTYCQPLDDRGSGCIENGCAFDPRATPPSCVSHGSSRPPNWQPCDAWTCGSTGTEKCPPCAAQGGQQQGGQQQGGQQQGGQQQGGQQQGAYTGEPSRPGGYTPSPTRPGKTIYFRIYLHVAT